MLANKKESSFLYKLTCSFIRLLDARVKRIEPNKKNDIKA
jgi:hypothetical protein